MNEISFVVAPDEFGIGLEAGLEPVVDGVSLVDVLKWTDGEIEHAGLTGIDRALRALRDVPEPGSPRAVRVLGCLCGVDDCSSVTATVSATDEAIIWADIHARGRTYAEIGPFVFAPSRYLAAVARPVQSERPIREAVDIEQLAGGFPRDPAAWLRAMTMAFGRDFFTPYEPHGPREIAARGARALADAGMPVSEQAVRAWARERGFSDDAIERYVTWFRELTHVSRNFR